MNKRDKIRLICMVLFLFNMVIFSYIIETNSSNDIINTILFIVFIILIGIYLTQDKLEKYE